MRILIADDELLVRIGIKSCIEWEKYGMEVAGEASDGLEALRLAKLCDPDVMLLDIKMPNMDGIELMHKLAEERSRCKVLILSGFDDIYHVKEAMRLGAADYLHKPCMRPEDILNALLGIKEQLEKEKPVTDCGGSTAKSSEKSEYLLKEAFLRELIEGAHADEREFALKSSELNLKLKPGNFTCLVFSVKNLSTVRERYADKNVNLLQSAISGIMPSILAKEGGVEFFTADKNQFVLLASFSGVISEKRINEGVSAVISLVADAMKRFLNVDVAIGVSGVHNTSSGVRQAYIQALAAVRYRFYLNDSNIIWFSDIKWSEDKETLLFIDGLIERMKEYLVRHDLQKFENTMENLVAFLLEEPCLQGEDVKKIFTAFLFLIKQGKAGLAEAEAINGCETLHELYALWKDIARERLEDGVSSLKYRNCSHLVKKLLAFIDENYMKEISLNLLADELNVSPNYISRIFREETGEALFNYINAVRVEKAKAYLRGTDLKIYEIAYRVGFNSTVHFNIVFNKLLGISPKQYKDSV